MERRYVAVGLAAVVVAGSTLWRQAHERHGFAWRPVAVVAADTVWLDETPQSFDGPWRTFRVTGPSRGGVSMLGRVDCHRETVDSLPEAVAPAALARTARAVCATR